MIRTSGLVKEYPSGKALDGVDLVVPAGAVLGLVGPNGAGKTTLLSILAGLRRPTAGTVEVDADRSRVAVLPDAPRFDPWLTGREVVELARRLTAPDTPETGTERVLDEAALADAADRRVAGYSRGMLQRLGLAATVVGDPDVLLLDEPASALDPIGRRDVLDLVRRMRGSATVVFSSHILADVQDVSDHLAILDRGRLRFQGPVDDLLGTGASAILVRTRDGTAAVEGALSGVSWVAGVERLDDRVVRLRVTDLDAAERHLPGVLAATGVRIVSIAPDTPTLEDVFLEVTG
jgi:ABC-2 type transport system ATP-binding protein